MSDFSSMDLDSYVVRNALASFQPSLRTRLRRPARRVSATRGNTREQKKTVLTNAYVKKWKAEEIIARDIQAKKIGHSTVFLFVCECACVCLTLSCWRRRRTSLCTIRQRRNVLQTGYRVATVATTAEFTECHASSRETMV